MTDITINEPNEEHPDTHRIVLRRRDPLDCLPHHVRRIGGRHHNHPHYRPATSEPPIVAGGLDGWTFAGARSNPTSCEVTFRKKRSTFAFYSSKTKRTQTGEGPWEFLNAQELEVNPQCLDYQLQGIQVFHRDEEDTARRFTPDALVLNVDGGIEAHEVKASASYFVQPDYESLITKVENDLAAIGIGFKKVTGDELCASPRREFNITEAFLDRFTAFGAREIEAVENLFVVDGGVTTMGRVHEAIGAIPQINKCVANAMLCSRRLSFSLDLPVDRNTVVTPAPSHNKRLPNIRTIAR